jgi:positive regulator of sigma E activity
MREFAKVVETLEGGRAIVEVERSAACENCASKCMVSKSALNVRAEASNAAGAKPGDVVQVEMGLSSALFASFVLYGVPIACFLAGSFAGYYYLWRLLPISQDACGFLCGIALTALACAAIRALDKKGLFRKKAQITILPSRSDLI